MHSQPIAKEDLSRAHRRWGDALSTSRWGEGPGGGNCWHEHVSEWGDSRHAGFTWEQGGVGRGPKGLEEGRRGRLQATWLFVDYHKERRDWKMTANISFKIEIQMLYNAALASAIQQSEPAVWTHASHPARLSLHPLGHRRAPSWAPRSCLFYTAAHVCRVKLTIKKTITVITTIHQETSSSKCTCLQRKHTGGREEPERCSSSLVVREIQIRTTTNIPVFLLLTFFLHLHTYKHL